MRVDQLGEPVGGAPLFHIGIIERDHGSQRGEPLPHEVIHDELEGAPAPCAQRMSMRACLLDQGAPSLPKTALPSRPFRARRS